MSAEVLILAISGSSGGNRGPQGIYNLFQDPLIQNKWNDKAVRVLQVDTVPESVEANVDQISRLALDQYPAYKQIYVVGYSMGGAVAVQVAHKLSEDAKKRGVENRVKGLALLATQTDGLHPLKEMNIPVLFYHGQEDPYFPVWQIESVYNGYNGPKKLVQVEGLGHHLAHEGNQYISSRYVNTLAKDIMSEISTLYPEAGSERRTLEGRVTKKIPLCRLDQFWNWILSVFCKKNEEIILIDDPLALQEVVCEKQPLLLGPTPGM